MNGWAKWAAIATVVVALPTLGWATGAVGNFHEHWQLVGANAKFISLAQYKVLSEVKAERRLTFDEWVEWCQLGIKLGFFTVCPPR